MAQQIEANLATKFAYSFGSIANGVKLRSISMFLLIYYNQVIGMSPALVSTIIMVSLIFDAIFDPLIGQISDNFHSRWGRRHPFMYASAIPYPLFFFLLFNPPDWSEPMLAAYLLVCLVGVRFFDTLAELPGSALGPELAKNYDSRTRLAAMRALVGTIGNLAVFALALNVFMKESAEGTGGVLARDGYLGYSATAALVIFATVLICSVGTHSFIPHLSKPEAKKRGFLQALKDFGQAVRNRSFIAIALANLLFAAAVYMNQALEMYWNLYLFKLQQSQIVIITTTSVVATIAGAIAAPLLARHIGKRNAAATLFGLWLLCSLAPVLMVATGMLTDPDTIFYSVMMFHSVALAAHACSGIMIFAMLMDIVEDVQLRTGSRSEGVLLGADNFVRKFTSGLGVLIAGMILTTVAFPAKAERTEVPEHTLDMMVALYVPVAVLLVAGCLAAISFYSLTRQVHQKNLAELELAQQGVGQ